MNHLTQLALIFTAHTSPPPPVPPTGPPVGLIATAYGFPTKLVRLDWTNGDPLAKTRLRFSTSFCPADGSTFDEVAAGVTTLDTTFAWNGTFSFTARHVRDGIESVSSNCTDAGGPS
jgi:hypothetical protein